RIAAKFLPQSCFACVTSTATRLQTSPLARSGFLKGNGHERKSECWSRRDGAHPQAVRGASPISGKPLLRKGFRDELQPYQPPRRLDHPKQRAHPHGLLPPMSHSDRSSLRPEMLGTL